MTTQKKLPLRRPLLLRIVLAQQEAPAKATVAMEDMEAMEAMDMDLLVGTLGPEEEVDIVAVRCMEAEAEEQVEGVEVWYYGNFRLPDRVL